MSPLGWLIVSTFGSLVLAAAILAIGANRGISHAAQRDERMGHDEPAGMPAGIAECGPLSRCARNGHIDALDHGPGFDGGVR